MVSLEGIVTRCKSCFSSNLDSYLPELTRKFLTCGTSSGSLVRPKMLKSIHYCPPTQKFHSRSYHDATTISSATATSSMPSTTVIPTDDGSGHPLVMEFGLSTFRDYQTISIQEMPERAPAGQLPRSVEVVLADDLVDSTKPGDRIQLVGVYKSSGGGFGSRGFQ